MDLLSSSQSAQHGRLFSGEYVSPLHHYFPPPIPIIVHKIGIILCRNNKKFFADSVRNEAHEKTFSDFHVLWTLAGSLDFSSL